MPVYSVWESRDGTVTLVEGAGPPAFADGTPQDPGAAKVLELEASGWDEARARQGAHYGWGAGKPPADPPALT